MYSLQLQTILSSLQLIEQKDIMENLKQNILIVGNGGREHAFTWHLSQSPLCNRLFVAPGNAGTASLATNLPIAVTDFEALGAACLQHQISLVVVGPEVPLVEGIVDYFAAQPALSQILIVGPSAKGAQLEGSKDFSKNFMQKYAIPTATYQTFTAEQWPQALEYVAAHSLPVVLKADGLAAGKGVIIAQTHEEATEALRQMLLEQQFGAASSKVVIEQYLDGIEVSVFVLTDGKNYKILPEAKDYKRIGEGDTGLNTGGMGAVSPVPFVDAAFMEQVEKTIIEPTIAGLAAEGIDYKGFIFIGLMNVAGKPYVIEYNVRMGDPETEAVVPRITSDLVEVFTATAQGRLQEVDFKLNPQTAVTVVLAAGGYPVQHQTGHVISGIEQAAQQADVLVFQAGTKAAEGQTLTNGGRVIAVTALADSLPEAQAKAMKAAETIQWQDRYFRRDVANDLKKYLSHSAY
ncbi:phosphoribosylamine--glycine ligase [Flexibacter flexilis DSM 6793]|uniref:Phosphoribosylamine--glycine ligase n=2 Tax=Flexibacter flexilis TaxID=998 RepID=A0A1I1JLD3_9BACT|nr:phosphoribosylamine--glycine ligase [Flexibacter flexilis DSM 6793]